MAITLHVDIVSAEKEIFSGLAELVVATAELGEIGIKPQHAPLLSSLKAGQVRVLKQNGEEEIFFISGGFIEVQPSIVTILADSAARATDIDEAAALEAKEKAEKALHDRSADLDYSRASAELARAVAQLRAIKTLRKRMKK